MSNPVIGCLLVFLILLIIGFYNAATLKEKQLDKLKKATAKAADDERNYSCKWVQIERNEQGQIVRHTTFKSCAGTTCRVGLFGWRFKQ